MPPARSLRSAATAVPDDDPEDRRGHDDEYRRIHGNPDAAIVRRHVEEDRRGGDDPWPLQRPGREPRWDRQRVDRGEATKPPRQRGGRRDHWSREDQREVGGDEEDSRGRRRERDREPRRQ